MTTIDRIEQRDIHLASCRARRQGLVCSTCVAVVERAARIEIKQAA